MNYEMPKYYDKDVNKYLDEIISSGYYNKIHSSSRHPPSQEITAELFSSLSCYVFIV
jgi:hypothetical protein